MTDLQPYRQIACSIGAIAFLQSDKPALTKVLGATALLALAYWDGPHRMRSAAFAAIVSVAIDCVRNGLQDSHSPRLG